MAYETTTPATPRASSAKRWYKLIVYPAMKGGPWLLTRSEEVVAISNVNNAYHEGTKET